MAVRKSKAKVNLPSVEERKRRIKKGVDARPEGYFSMKTRQFASEAPANKPKLTTRRDRADQTERLKNE